jgi:hypothetical protein
LIVGEDLEKFAFKNAEKLLGVKARASWIWQDICDLHVKNINAAACLTASGESRSKFKSPVVQALSVSKVKMLFGCSIPSNMYTHSYRALRSTFYSLQSQFVSYTP